MEKAIFQLINDVCDLILLGEKDGTRSRYNTITVTLIISGTQQQRKKESNIGGECSLDEEGNSIFDK